jgi:hypothetical protein
MSGRGVAQRPVLHEVVLRETYKARARSAAIARQLEIKFLIVVLSLLLFTDVFVQNVLYNNHLFLVTPCKMAKSKEMSYMAADQESTIGYN